MNDFEYYLEQSANDAKSFLDKSEMQEKVKENLEDLKNKVDLLNKKTKYFNEDDTAYWDDALELLARANENIDDLLSYFKN